MKEQGSLTRRNFIAALGVGGLSAFVGNQYINIGSIGRPESFHYTGEEAFREGFFPLEPDHPLWKDISTPEKRTAVPYKAETIHGRDSFLQTELYFTVEEDSPPLELTMSGAATSNVSAQPFIATLDNGKQFMLPFVQSVRPSYVTTFLGSLEKGEHALQLNEIPSDYPLGNDVLYPYHLNTVSGTPLQNYLRRTQPRYALRSDNIPRMKNDMPLLEISEFLRRAFDNMLLVKKTVIYTSEDRGLSPQERLERYGRTTDVEPSVQQKVKVRHVIGFPGEEEGFLPIDDQPYQAIVQVPGRKTPHAWAEFDGKTDNDQPLLQIKTGNNLLSEEAVTKVFFDPSPVYGLGEHVAAALLQANPEWQILSFHEIDGETSLDRSLPQAGHLAEVQLHGLEEHPMGSYPSTDVLTASR